jgi:predicted NBD/HSP70 family sugar kinase
MKTNNGTVMLGHSRLNISKPRALKQNNRKLVLDIFRSKNELMVGELSNSTGLSRTTIIKIISHFVNNGFIISSGKGDSTDEGGKKPKLYSFNPRRGHVIGMTIFPDKINCGLFDLNADILDTISSGLSDHEELDSVVKKIVFICDDLLIRNNMSYDQIIGIAVGSDGIVDVDRGVVCYATHFPNWGTDIPLKERILEIIGQNIPIFIDNSVRLRAFAEEIKGSAMGKESIITIYSGIGIASCMINNGQIQRGAHHLTGEIGHIILNPFDEEVCHCGGKGCFEVMISMKRIIGMITQNSYDFPNSSLLKNGKPENIKLGDIFRESNKNDSLSILIIDYIVKWFAIAIHNIILSHDPDKIILQGDYKNAGKIFRDKLISQLTMITFPKVRKHIEIVYSKLDDNITFLTGPAYYAINEYFMSKTPYQ